jgi:hypothetical protein
MASPALKHEVDELREYMKELSYQAMRTEMSLNRLSGEMREFKYADRRAVRVLASLYPDEGVVRRATCKGVLVRGMGDEVMQVLNSQALKRES